MKLQLTCLALVFQLCLLAQDRGFKLVKSSSADHLEVFYENSYALVIGNNHYTQGWPDLPGVEKDLHLVSQALMAKGFQVEKAQNLSKEELDSAFSSFILKYGKSINNRLLFYFAGHGHTIETNYGDKLGYIVPTNAPDPNIDAMAFQSQSMEMAQLEIYAKRIESKHALFVFDACFSGSLFGASRAIPEVISYKTRQPVRQFISSGAENEKVPDESIFRRQFVDAISTSLADYNEDGYLTGTELGRFLQTSVINYSRGSQHPQYGKINNPSLNRGDFIFAVGTTKLTGPSETPFLSKKQVGAVSLSSELGGDFYLDGRLLTAIRSFTQIPINDISPGLHTFEIKGKESWKADVQIIADSTISIDVKSKVITDDRSSFIDLTYVRGGTFPMGSDLELGEPDESPVHFITVNDFEIGTYEVTVGQFESFIKATGYQTEAEKAGWAWGMEGGDWVKKPGLSWKNNTQGEIASNNQPVAFVSWNDCQAFIMWLSDMSGENFRLPTEAEWEYAARGGIHSLSKTYAGGDRASDLGWFSSNSPDGIQSVGLKAANELLLHDMSGNLWEWCQDWYSEQYYKQSLSSNPSGGLKGEFRVLRGGSWKNNERSGRITNRHKNRPNERDGFTGFRVVRQNL